MTKYPNTLKNEREMFKTNFVAYKSCNKEGFMEVSAVINKRNNRQFTGSMAKFWVSHVRKTHGFELETVIEDTDGNEIERKSCTCK